MRLVSKIAGFIPLVLIIISFIFTVLSTTSKQWAYQNFYSEGEVVALDQQIKPLWTIYRSPFWTCGRPADPQPGDHTVLCTRHSLTSFGHRACETLAGTNLPNGQDNPAYGDPRQCQQIHMAASLTVSSSIFSGLALLTTLLFLPLSHLRPTQHTHTSPTSPVQLINIWIIFSLSVSGIMLVLAQFYGVLGLIQSALPNGAYATNISISASSGPWIQGKASVIYASIGWFAAFLATGCMVVVWGVPSFAGVGAGEEREKHGRRHEETRDS
ncbi:hypothetical protein F5882DRAFT_512801 [Hyaloscypha sp. PMI_1271]|nr:hypothetical protein F5882DRAFT_512801 [Hyaloscypha sp. PMI_1271]